MTLKITWDFYVYILLNFVKSRNTNQIEAKVLKSLKKAIQSSHLE